MLSLVNGGLDPVLLNDSLGLALLHCRLNIILSKPILVPAVLLASLDCLPDSFRFDYLLLLALLDSCLEIILRKYLLGLVVLALLDCVPDSSLVDCLLLVALINCLLDFV